MGAQNRKIKSENLSQPPPPPEGTITNYTIELEDASKSINQPN